ncbi:hypothetical protein DFH09DRAFT_1108596 [Mycena vulgaris]|nr:hypothetical protein DFH09DRAFT_1108596 [Mycena vulgaris]
MTSPRQIGADASFLVLILHVALRLATSFPSPGVWRGLISKRPPLNPFGGCAIVNTHQGHFKRNIIHSPYSRPPPDYRLRASHPSSTRGLPEPQMTVGIVGGFDEHLIITRLDFPRGWVTGHHPDDYKMRSTPLQPECFINPLRYHIRMWFRTSFKIADGQYMPMSFLVDY